MARQGIREVLCLLDEVELASYRSSLLHRYQREFLRVTHVPVEGDAIPSPSALENALAALRRAEAEGGPVVVHGGAGVVRTGLVLAAWARARHGVSPEAAVAMTQRHAAHFGARRDPLQAGAAAALEVLSQVTPLR
jgi:atypical dual specificity phosphatase